MSSPVKGFEERRQSRRVDMEEADIIINWQDKDERRQQTAGRCLDLSRSGALLETADAIGEGYQVTVSLNPNSELENQISGQVLRVTPKGECFHIALKLDQ
ncbi:PilZ domain-containing protein [Shewanella submarina]|uniref:PilZ domain-containing protein n=1 Tax=Shewanella submarina TaxID=2016376 RepID=A0ABV7GAT5_9GAMM|nr:PilZ domain-containing protein [Shewanella submarina]MCL1037740.1 PilZ domain-containing protein [Shewanella submarina]